MTLMCKPTAVALAMVLTGVAGATAQAADAFPARPVRLIVPYPPGGTIDALARDYAEHLRTRWSQPVLVENRGGANGMIGVDAVRRAPADGYTLLVGGGSTHSIGPVTEPEMKYDPIREFTAIAYFGDTPMVVTAGPKFAAQNFAQVVTRARARAGSVSYGSVGTTTVLATRLLEKAAGMQLLGVSYKQFGPALIDITRGDVDLGVSSLSIVHSHIQAKTLRPLVVTSRERSKLLPDVPTVAETYPDFEVLIWFGLFGPANLPEPVRAALYGEAVAYQRTPGRADKWLAQAFSLRTRTPAEFNAYLKSDYEKWRAVAAEAGIKGGQ